MNEVRIRRLNDEGLKRFHSFLDSFGGDSERPLTDIDSVLTDLGTTEHVPGIVKADRDAVFTRRFDLAAYLYKRVPSLDLPDPTRDVGLWAWLALLWFEQLAPIEGKSRKVGELAKWIPQPGWKYYRHVVLGPYLLYSANEDRPERAMAVLFNPPHTPGELVGQLAATQDVAQSKAAIGAATELYYDPVRKEPKRGAGGSGPGSPRRYRTVLDQFDCTFDLQSISALELLQMLPKEFAKFRPSSDRPATKGS